MDLNSSALILRHVIIMQQNSKGNSNYKIKNTTHTPCTQSHNTHTHTHTHSWLYKRNRYVLQRYELPLIFYLPISMPHTMITLPVFVVFNHIYVISHRHTHWHSHRQIDRQTDIPIFPSPDLIDLNTCFHVEI